MRKHHYSFAAAIAALLFGAPSWSDEIPHLQRNGKATQLIVDGAPYLALAGELHNSSASSPRYMAPIWDRLEKSGLNTVIGTASWELVEPQEGHFDFAAVDDEIGQAHAHGLHLVLIWFGAYKNADANYTPSWVRRDEARFPRGLRDPAASPSAIAAYQRTPIISVFNDRLVAADSHAFAALMRHVRQVDKAGTVMMVQVENETGLLGSARDHSPLANTAWQQQVPTALMRYLRQNRAKLRPEIVKVWGERGFRESGSWADVFGNDPVAEQVFMAWGFGHYVDRVARAGAAEYPLPMYANAWLNLRQGVNHPGDYPSGGPVSSMMDIWKAAAPSLALQAPDIYIDDFAGTLADFSRADNPIFIPEARFDAGNLFVAFGEFNAISFSPFGIEDGAQDDDVFKAYRLLRDMVPQITSAQAEGRIRGFRVAGGSPQKETLGGYDITVSGNRGTLGAFGPGTGTADAAKVNGYGLLIQSGPNEFTVVGRGISLDFSQPGKVVEVDSAREGTFNQGQWVAGRTLNGDERYFLFPPDQLHVVRITLLSR